MRIARQPPSMTVGACKQLISTPMRTEQGSLVLAIAEQASLHCTCSRVILDSVIHLTLIPRAGVHSDLCACGMGQPGLCLFAYSASPSTCGRADNAAARQQPFQVLPEAPGASLLVAPDGQ